ncbi:MAG: histidinol-phosphate transaminase [Chitinophagaceae bacterium]|nr:histidinol-phosphate transaminase [Chitinophagaceae bacterium]
MFNPDQIARKNILALKPYSSARDEYSGSDGIFLDANENPYGTLNRYPDPHQQKLKTVISQQKGISPENIFLGNGSDEIIDLLIRIFCEPGKDKILTLTPTYGMYAVSAAVNDVSLIEIPLDKQFQPDISRINPVLDDTNCKLIFLCSPNNPTGNCLEAESISTLLSRFKGIVVIDEAYIDFTTQPSWCRQLTAYPNLVVMQTFSKAWGLAAARVGIGFGSAAIIQLLNKVKPPYNISGPNQEAVLQALEKGRQNLADILAERTVLQKALGEITAVKKIYPTEANFILFEVADASDTYEKLVLQKIITRNRHSVVRNCIRVTVGTAEENKTFITALKTILA